MKMNFDKNFISSFEALNNFEKKGDKNIEIAILQNGNILYSYKSKIISSDFETSFFYIRKIIITLIFMVGGEALLFKGSKEFFNYLISKIDNDDELSNSFKNMEVVFNKKFEVKYSEKEFVIKENIIPLSGDFKGCRIGFDAGGSDRKVSAVIDGNVVFSEEILRNPKEVSNWEYHYDGILDSMKKAASHLPHVDAIGVSTAGIVMNNEMAQANLFIKVPLSDQISHCRNIYKDIVKNEFNNVPLVVANDGDVTALSGAIHFNKNYILGLAMGTSEATGYSANNSLNGWINELGKVPMNYDDNASKHYATQISGAGSEYLSQKGVIKLSKMAGVSFEGTLAEQLVKIQEEAKNGNEKVLKAYEDMGIYLGSSLAYYNKFLRIENVLLLGRVMTGIGGDLIIKKANEYLKENDINSINIFTADEKFKRLGQSYMAASLPKIL